MYLAALAVVCATAAVLAAVRWRQDGYLALLATLAFGAALVGLRARRRRPPGRPTRHAVAMATSYTVLLIGFYADNFYADNGPHLPLRDRLPHLLHWVLPPAAALPLTWAALVRRRRATADPGRRLIGDER